MSQPRTPHRAARKWQWLSVGSGLLLASAFFMPAVQSCGSPVIPAKEVREAWDQFDWSTVQSISKASGFVLFVLVFISAYVFGLMMAASAAIRLIAPRSTPRRIARAIAVLVLAVTVVVEISIGLICLDGFPSGTPLEWLVLCGWAILVASIFVHTWVALRVSQEYSWMLGGSLAGLIWFTPFAVQGALYGVYVSLAACAGLILAVVGEARALTRQGWWRTLGQLLTCGLVDPPDWRGHCPQCDYDLTGLPEPRCPECGCAFTWEEVGLAAPPQACVPPLNRV